MKAALLQSVCDNYGDFIDLTSSHNRSYAEKMGFDYVLHENLFDHGRHPAWNKIFSVQLLFEQGYEYVFFMDGDAVVIDSSKNIMGDVDSLWNDFLQTNNYGLNQVDVISSHKNITTVTDSADSANCQNNIKFKIKKKSPKCGDLFISTQTKIVHLDNEIPLKDIFWKLPVINYLDWSSGIIKKQMKSNSNTKEELELIG